jgi:HSP20 family protein
MPTRTLAKSFLTPSLYDNFFKPWNELMNTGGLMDKVMSVPAVNVTENKDQYNVSLAAPGLKKEDFRIDIEGNMLNISSEKEEKTEEKEEKFTRKEYSYSSFSRSFTIPEDVKMEAIEANYTDGLLNIRLPRKEDTSKMNTSKKIDVK